LGHVMLIDMQVEHSHSADQSATIYIKALLMTYYRLLSSSLLLLLFVLLSSL